jgi:TPR repeat protein
MYRNGQGAPQNYKQAATWYQKAAVQGYTAAQYNLGLMYYNGQGVRQNNKNAYAWWALTAMNGDENSRKKRDETAKKLSPSELEKAQELAAKLYDKINN